MREKDSCGTISEKSYALNLSGNNWRAPVLFLVYARRQ